MPRKKIKLNDLIENEAPEQVEETKTVETSKPKRRRKKRVKQVVEQPKAEDVVVVEAPKEVQEALVKKVEKVVAPALPPTRKVCSQCHLAHALNRVRCRRCGTQL